MCKQMSTKSCQSAKMKGFERKLSCDMTQIFVLFVHIRAGGYFGEFDNIFPRSGSDPHRAKFFTDAKSE